MKVKNFPGRKQDRREGAYDRLVARIGSKTPTKNQAIELEALEAWLAKGDMSGIRTKKFRG